MNDPASILFSYAMEQNIFPKYIDGYARFLSKRKANSAVYDRIRTLLNESAQKELDVLIDEENHLDAIHLEAAFTAGLALGLQLLRLV